MGVPCADLTGTYPSTHIVRHRMREVKKIISTILAAPSGITGARSSISSRITSPIWTTNNYKKASVSVRLGRRSTYKYQLLCLHRQSAPPNPEGQSQPAGAGKVEVALHTSFVGLQNAHTPVKKDQEDQRKQTSWKSGRHTSFLQIQQGICMHRWYWQDHKQSCSDCG